MKSNKKFLLHFDCIREKAVRKCKNEPDQGFCTQLLIMDGWEFKNDYPLRI